MIFIGVKCPVCSKVVISEDIELHLVVCLTKPRLSYNGKYEELKDGILYFKTNFQGINMVILMVNFVMFRIFICPYDQILIVRAACIFVFITLL